MEAIIQVRDVTKTFVGKDNKVEALKGINLDIHKGEIYGIIGMSGAGKSTLVRCLNFLERPTTGTVFIEGKDLSQLKEGELRKTRTEIAMIFQHFNLLMQRNVIDNICFPMEIKGTSRKDAVKRAKELLEIVGLSEKAKAYPAQLSGGQKQRVAIARALVSEAPIILADEPTGNLDTKTSIEVMEFFVRLNEEMGKTIVLVTHEPDIAEYTKRVVKFKDGNIILDEPKDVWLSHRTRET